MKPLRHRAPRFLVALAIACAPTITAAQMADQFAAVRDTIRRIMEARRIPAVAVAVSKGDRILWEEGFGFADVENKVATTAETMFSLASISKPFTATGIMVLVDRKALDLDRPANDYLGSAKLRAFEGKASEITVRRILSHSAGLPLHYQFFYEGGTPAHDDDVAITKYGFAGYAPGEAYFYSNLGYGILGHMLGLASKGSYEEFMRKNVFEPLDLKNTTVSTGKNLGKRAALRYNTDLKPIPPYGFDHAAASAVWSSAHDLVRFGMFHVGVKVPNQKAILTTESRKAMQRAEAPPTGPNASYGLGWATQEDDFGYRRLQHTGGMPGVSTMLNLYPSDSVVVVVLTNRDNIGPTTGQIASAIASIVLPNYAATREQRRTGGPPRVTQLSTLTLPGLSGSWRGFAIVEGDSVPVVLDATSGATRLQIGSDTSRTVNVNATNGWYSMSTRTPLRAPDAAPSSEAGRTAVTLTLRPRGDRITGWVSSISQGPPAYGAVSYRLELQRQ